MTQETGSALAVPTPQQRFQQLNAQLAAFPREQYNWLIPTAAQEISPFFRPVVVAVKIDPNSDDVYEPAGRGKLALHAHALQRLSNGTGITWEEARLTKQGRWTWVASIAGWWTHPNGERIRQPGIYTLDVEDDGVIVKRIREKVGREVGGRKFSDSDAERDIDSYRQFGGQRAVTGAQSIVIRKCNGMKATYTKDELARPFVCVLFRPDESIPEVRSALSARLVERERQVFGGAPALAAGPELPTQEVREVAAVESDEAKETEPEPTKPVIDVPPATPSKPAEPPVIRDEPAPAPPAPQQQQLVRGPKEVIAFYQHRLEELRQHLTAGNGAPWSTAARQKAASERQVGMVAGKLQEALKLGSDDDAKAARREILAALWGGFNDYSELNSDQVSATIDWAKTYPQEVAEFYAALRS